MLRRFDGWADRAREGDHVVMKLLVDTPFELAGELEANRDGDGAVVLDSPHLRADARSTCTRVLLTRKKADVESPPGARFGYTTSSTWCSGGRNQGGVRREATPLTKALLTGSAQSA